MMALGLISPKDLREAGLELQDFANPLLVDTTAVAVHTRIAPKHVLYLDGRERGSDGGLLHPGHVISIDHASKAVVFAIRGTANFDVRPPW